MCVFVCTNHGAVKRLATLPVCVCVCVGVCVCVCVRERYHSCLQSAVLKGNIVTDYSEERSELKIFYLNKKLDG